jgi:hypothetical protein
METSIVNRALRVQFVTFNLLLLIWSIVEATQTGTLPLALIVLLSGNIVFFASLLFFRKRPAN